MSQDHFRDATAQYLESARRQVPGLDGLHRMVSLLLAERVPDEGKVLVLGAGGGLELLALAERHPGWQFDGVDPSAAMLELAAETLGPHRERVQLHEGRVEVAPAGPYDGAVCLLTFHFIGPQERADTLRALRRRLRPGAPLCLAHISFAQDEPQRSQWVARHVGFGMDEVAPAERVERFAAAMAEKLTVLSPQEDEAMLAAAGFSAVTLFYAGLSLRGWVAAA